MKAFFIISFVWVVQILTLRTSAQHQGVSRVSYGENCSKEIRCESRNFLTCSNGQCDCLMIDTMVFEEASGKCVTLAGERCQFNTVEGESMWMEEVPCITHAVCRNGVCECGSGYFEISNGTCQPKREHGAECFNNEMCDDQKHFICGNDKTCACEQSLVLSQGTCVRPAGSHCPGDNVECTHHSECVMPVYPDIPVPTCKCVKNYFQAENGTCERKRSLGENCADDSQCIDYIVHPLRWNNEFPSLFRCVQGTCQCNESISIKNNRNFAIGPCGKYIGQPCNDEWECVNGATCSGVCQCESTDFFVTTNKTCEQKREHGQPCTTDGQCQERLQLKCDQFKRECKCQSGYVKSPGSGQCVVEAGNVCKDYNRFEKSCVPNAVCKEEQRSSWKTCVCNENAKMFDGYCYIKENEKCDGDQSDESFKTNTCFPGLVCRNSTCACPYKDHQVFNDAYYGKCQSLIGGPCSESIDCRDRNAECFQERGVGQCHCKKGFTQVGRSCDIAYGEECNQGVYQPRCDRFGPLECSARKVCECSDFQFYDNNTLACKGLVGATCKAFGSTPREIKRNAEFCVEGAFCQPFRGFDEVNGLCVCRSGWTMETNRTCSLLTTPTSTTTVILDEVELYI